MTIKDNLFRSIIEKKMLFDIWHYTIYTDDITEIDECNVYSGAYITSLVYWKALLLPY